MLLAAVALLSLTGCVGAIGDAPVGIEGDGNNETPAPRDAGRVDATTPRRDATVVADKPIVTDDEPIDDPPETPVIVPEDLQPDAGTPSTPADVCPGTQQQPLATGVQIKEIALYQTVKVSLYKDGAWATTRSAPVVQGKKSLVRVFVNTLAGYQPRMLKGLLTLSNGTQTTAIPDQRSITGNSTDDQLNSTFSFQVDGAQLSATTQLSVAIEELECGDDVGTAANARFPTTGTRSLDALEIAKLKVVILPINIGGRLPVTTDKELANIRDSLLAYYPVPDVDVSVRAPLVWTAAIDPLDGSTWSDVLMAVMNERRKDAPAANVYYFGLMQPAATFRTYCPRGCILGLAPQTTTVQTSAQIGLGASFADAQTYETVVHELGHAHGRGHAPCVEGGEIDGVDPKYPEPTGGIVTWGWDSRSNALKDPSDKDIMGYCEPNWISTYNYALNATRCQQVNARALVANAKSAVPWEHILLYADGSARWGGSNETLKPGGTSETVDILDAQNNVIGQTEVVRIALSHSGDQFAYIPAPQASWAALKLSDRTLVLNAIKPAL